MQEAIRFLAAPTTDKAGGKSVDEAVEEERRWVEGLSRVPSAKLLVQHFCAFDSIIRSGGQHGVEPASDQVSTWRRMFCWQLKQSDAPFGIKGENGRLPKCVAMCNLSGQHAFYYCETFSLARILCLVPQDSHMRVIVGVSKVIAKASELGASLWAGFCLPFQVGLDRCYWEVRTVRKTSAGKVRDGELAFGSEDAEPRTMGCTEDSEHWSDAMLSELCKKMLKVVSPACIDIQDDHDVSMTPERMELAIKILKTDRKKTQELHRETVEGIRDTYSAIVQDLEKKAANAEEEANTRVSGVLKTAQAAKSAAESKINELQQHVSTLSAQLASQRNAAEDAKSRMAGMMLKHEEENVTRAARQKTLEAQIASMSSNHARQVAENSKRLKETAKSHEVAMAALKQNLADSQKKVKALTSATQAMNASVKEAHCSSALLSKKLRVMRCVVELGGLRFSDLQKQVAELETTETEVKKDLDVLRTRMKDMVKRSTVDPEASTDTAISSMRTTDADSCKVRPPANVSNRLEAQRAPALACSSVSPACRSDSCVCVLPRSADAFLCVFAPAGHL